MNILGEYRALFSLLALLVVIVIDDGQAAHALEADPTLSWLADWQYEINIENAQIGSSVADAGDVNGDGYSDVVLGAPLYTADQVFEGGVVMFYGSETGLPAMPDTVLEGNQSISVFGEVVSGAGDINGDGYDDIIVGSRLMDDGEEDEGVVYVFNGGSSGIATLPSWQVEGGEEKLEYGASVAGAGDVNGDGYDDIIVGIPLKSNSEKEEGAVQVYYGSSLGLNVIPAIQLESDQVGARFGASISSAGDINADGYFDIVVGAPYYSNGATDEGAVFIYLGSDAGISSSPSLIIEGQVASAHFGESVSGAGDVNGDGYDDVIVGAPYYEDGQIDEGAVFVFLGAAAGLSVTPAWEIESNIQTVLFGISVDGAGDVNGDGYDDVIVGASYVQEENDRDSAYLFMGSYAGIISNAVNILTNNFPNSQFGFSVSSAGDVNGDGYSDVIVGATTYENGEANEGSAYGFYGNVNGFASQSDDLDSDGVLDINDLFPTDPTEWSDADMDALGDNADWDDDNDNVPDSVDQDPLDELNSNEIVLALDALYMGKSISLTGELIGAPGPFVPWDELLNPVYAILPWSVKDAAMIYKDGLFYIFYSAFFYDEGEERCHVVSVKTSDFIYFSKPLFTLSGVTDNWAGYCSPDIIEDGGSYILTYNSWGDKFGKPNQLFYATSDDLETWSFGHPLASDLTENVRAIDAALAVHNGRYHLIWKADQTPQVAYADSIDGPWTLIGQPSGGWFENNQFINIDDTYHLVVTGVGHEPYLMQMIGDPDALASWLSWTSPQLLDIPQENFNTDNKANAAYLSDWRSHDGHYYLLYAGRTEGISHAGRGDNKLGLARSIDLSTWWVPPQ